MCFRRRRNRFCRHAGWAETLGASEQQGMTRGEKGPSRRTYSAQASAAHQGARCSGAALPTIPVRIQLHLSQEQSSSLEVQYLGDKNALCERKGCVSSRSFQTLHAFTLWYAGNKGGYHQCIKILGQFLFHHCVNQEQAHWLNKVTIA